MKFQQLDPKSSGAARSPDAIATAFRAGGCRSSPGPDDDPDILDVYQNYEVESGHAMSYAKQLEAKHSHDRPVGAAAPYISFDGLGLAGCESAFTDTMFFTAASSADDTRSPTTKSTTSATAFGSSMASSRALIQRNAGSLGTLADAEHYHEPVMIDADDTEALLAGLQRMILIRVVEEKIGDMVSQGVVKCPCHLAIGQEAPAVGVASYVRQGDRVFGAHRSHSHFLALGAHLTDACESRERYRRFSRMGLDAPD